MQQPQSRKPVRRLPNRRLIFTQQQRRDKRISLRSPRHAAQIAARISARRARNRPATFRTLGTTASCIQPQQPLRAAPHHYKCAAHPRLRTRHHTANLNALQQCRIAAHQRSRHPTRPRNPLRLALSRYAITAPRQQHPGRLNPLTHVHAHSRCQCQLHPPRHRLHPALALPLAQSVRPITTRTPRVAHPQHHRPMIHRAKRPGIVRLPRIRPAAPPASARSRARPAKLRILHYAPHRQNPLHTSARPSRLTRDLRTKPSR